MLSYPQTRLHALKSLRYLQLQRLQHVKMSTEERPAFAATYLQALQSLKQYQEVKLDLSNAEKLATLMGRPHQQYKIVHVAGTNGKGSTVVKIKECLKLKGYKVGMFTSPHLCSFRERFQINDELISEEDLVRHINLVWSTAKNNDLNITFFEICTQIAFNYFGEKSVDWAVVEAGVGGRLDATNIVEHPEACVITSIGHDHMPTLGNTLAEVAMEKAGILKPNVPVVLGPTVTIYEDVWKKAKEMSSEVFEVKSDPRGMTFDDENKLIAGTTITKALKIDMPSKLLVAGLDVRPYLRFQKLTEQQRETAFQKCRVFVNHYAKHINTTLADVNYVPPVVIDVGHNEPGLERLCQDIGHHYYGKAVRICFSLSADKTITVMQAFLNHFSFPKDNRLMGLHFLPSLHSRSKHLGQYLSAISELTSPYDELKDALMDGLHAANRWITCGPFDEDTALPPLEPNKYEQSGNLCKILSAALLQCAKEESMLIICGSFYFMDNVLDCLSLSIGSKDEVPVSEGMMFATDRSHTSP